jgi:hypothetical protein
MVSKRCSCTGLKRLKKNRCVLQMTVARNTSNKFVMLVACLAVTGVRRCCTLFHLLTSHVTRSTNWPLHRLSSLVLFFYQAVGQVYLSGCCCVAVPCCVTCCVAVPCCVTC